MRQESKFLPANVGLGSLPQPHTPRRGTNAQAKTDKAIGKRQRQRSWLRNSDQNESRSKKKRPVENFPV